jgi:hypothetical protein
MDLLTKRLVEFQTSHELVGVHCDSSETSRFQLGWMVDVGKESYALVALDEDGKFDAVSLGFIADIVRLSYGGPYIEHVTGRASFEQAISSFDIRKVSASLPDMISHASQENLVVDITDRSWELVRGFIRTYDTDFLEVDELGRSGERLAKELVRMDDVLRIELFGPFARRFPQ